MQLHSQIFGILCVFFSVCQASVFFLVVRMKKRPNAGKIDNIIVYYRVYRT